ncbi:hypothetical protein GCM10008026_35200 [Chelatococcus composti]|uniref:Uncharacterized protein n=1 Tax=Chelatococcus composti TaxID=1743235 RepID=A0A841KFX1_9HYPH|nr:hypothetical protein [Chelatococcus composti]GGG50941.1 hypothetical protein GCM10008026_35200 [Chelatococcus composti]
MIHGKTADLAPTGFGQQVREAMDQRREHHIEQANATRSRDGRIFYRRNLLATLREREVMGVVQGGSVSWQLGKQRGLGR